MRDYIDILIWAVQEENPCCDAEYLRQREGEIQAEKALRAALNDEQNRLYRRYEEQRGLVLSLYETDLLRKVFLLAREVCR